MIAVQNEDKNGGLVCGVERTRLVTGLAACFSILATCCPATASIVFTMPPNPVHAGILPDEPPAAIDLNDDGVIDFIIPGGNAQINVLPQGFNRVLSIDEFGTLYAADLSEGSFIGADPGDGRVWGAGSPVMAACFSGGGVVCFGNFLGGIDYLGAEFEIAGNTHYGWLEIRSRDGIPFIDVLSWAYETEPGMGILAGAIPEPTATSLLLAAGLLAVRRRRKCNRPG